MNGLHRPGPQTRFDVDEAAAILRVGRADVLRYIGRGWITARRVWGRWSSYREHVGYSIRGRAIQRALDDCRPEFMAELWRDRAKELERKRRREGGMEPRMEVARPPRVAPQNGGEPEPKTTHGEGGGGDDGGYHYRLWSRPGSGRQRGR